MTLLQNYLFKFAITVFLLIIQKVHLECAALLLKCPLYQMRLQKIVGFRPAINYLSERNLIYAPAHNFKDRNRTARSGSGSGYAPPERDYAGPPASMLCWRICHEDDDCMAYVHLLDTNECYGYSYFERNARYLAISGELPLVADAEAIFYEKTCLRVPDTCKGRLWTLTKIPGTSLVFQSKKTITTLVTRRECAERCLFEREFKCLSASFAPSYRNNRERFIAHTSPKSQHTTLGRCMLSDKDKTIQPDAFRAAPYDEEYIENQCYERAVENDNCAYELYANSSFIYAEAKYLGLTQKECQALCTHETKFYCQGVSFYYLEAAYTRSECALHSEDIISLGPRSLKLRNNSVYMRRVKCLDVQVLCTHEEMAIKYTPKDAFIGKMYASMHSRDCTATGNGNQSIVLRLEIGSEPKENRCGILRAYEMTKSYQRTFISALVVIQNNQNVQTQGDRLIKVGCIMSNSTAPAPSAEGNYDDNVGGGTEHVPNAIALESSLEYADSLLPHGRALHINNNISSSAGHNGWKLASPLPKITLQIVDLAHQHETNDVQIGQNLELQIIAEYTPYQVFESLEVQLPPLPDFRATKLAAKSENNDNYVLLIDERGCPTDVSVFPELTRVRTHSKSMLRSRFQAFKFSGTSNVNFDVKIRFCGQHCPATNCLQYGGDGRNADSWQRRRRQAATSEPQQHPLKVQNPVYISTVIDINDDNHTQPASSNAIRLQDRELFNDTPLNYNLRVRGPDQVNSNSLLYGERGVLLIAGIDDQLHLDSICLNQSLLMAIFIFWLMFQVALLYACGYVLVKYRRLANLENERRRLHEEYIEARRVHWADQGGYTL